MKKLFDSVNLVAVLVSLSLIFSFGAGSFSFESLALSAEADVNVATDVNVGAKLGYHYTFKDAEQSGIYIDVLGNYKEFVKAGIGTDLHLVDGNIKANFGVVAGLHVPFSSTENLPLSAFSADLRLRYDFINITDAPALSFDIGASADVYALLTNSNQG